MPLPVIDPAHYDAQLEAKVQRFLADFTALDVPAPQVFASPPLHYRLRAEFRIWHDGDNLDYVMFDPDAPRTPIAMREFPVGSQRINALMPALRERLLAEPQLKRKLYSVEFLTTLSGDALITLVYHRPLDAAWQQAANPLEAQLNAGIIGRSRGQKIVLSRDYVTEQLKVKDRTLAYRQIEGSFTQPNGHMNQHMLSWASERVENIGGDLIELYCGNGNFTIALAPHFERVLATEISKTSILAAQHNLAANQVSNVAFARLSSDEISTALAGEREFRRLRDIPLQQYRFTTLLIDPPRAGLDERTLNLACRFDNILYISCNPVTLRENLIALNASHRIDALALFDQFPYTHHLECGVLLKKR
ncbi:MAG TPA: tRNA (uridine(54)-C5)-methyltransferase TrmA [Spongiibacteraceae bacterium]|nr:tRNA (uridine(54)-C5)-methyltransferase TrmA [Spongiibacteraceae bacterium]